LFVLKNNKTEDNNESLISVTKDNSNGRPMNNGSGGLWKSFISDFESNLICLLASRFCSLGNNNEMDMIKIHSKKFFNIFVRLYYDISFVIYLFVLFLCHISHNYHKALHIRVGLLLDL